MDSAFIEQLFWYDCITQTLNHEECEDSATMYIRINQLTQEFGLTLNVWNLQSSSGWYTSAYHGGSTPFKTNLHQVDSDKVPTDIRLLCTLLNIQWRY